MLSEQFVREFAEDWIAAWNTHNLSRVLAHYTEDFEMSSPFIAQIAGEPSGVLKGKAAVGAYWQAAMEKYPELHFDLLRVTKGANSVVLVYHSVGGRLAAEVFYFNAEGLVYLAGGHYGLD